MPLMPRAISISSQRGQPNWIQPGSRLKCYHRESALGICIEITSCPATSLVQPLVFLLLLPPRRFFLFSPPPFSLFSLFFSSRSESSRSIFQFAVPEVERSRLKEASLLISNCRAFSLFFPANGEETSPSRDSRFRLHQPQPASRPTPFVRFALVSVSATGE